MTIYHVASPLGMQLWPAAPMESRQGEHKILEPAYIVASHDIILVK
jgi:hypothetical protein